MIEHSRKQQEAEQKAGQIQAAWIAYNTAALSRRKRFPESLKSAFPHLFDLTDDGRIKAQNWQAAEAAMSRFTAYHNAQNKKKRGGKS